MKKIHLATSIHHLQPHCRVFKDPTTILLTTKEEETTCDACLNTVDRLGNAFERERRFAAIKAQETK